MLRIFFNRWLAATVEVSDYIFSDDLENATVDQSLKGTCNAPAAQCPRHLDQGLEPDEQRAGSARFLDLPAVLVGIPAAQVRQRGESIDAQRLRARTF